MRNHMTILEVYHACILELLELNKGAGIVVDQEAINDLLKRRLVTFDKDGNYAITRLGERHLEAFVRLLEATSGDVMLQGQEPAPVPDYLPNEHA